MFTLPAPTPPEVEARVHELGRGEQLVLMGFRALALGHGDCPAVGRAFHGLLGGEAEAALAHLMVFTRVVGGACRRRIRLHAPGCCAVSADEAQVLEVVAAAQGACAGRGERELRDRLGALLDRAPCEAAMMAAEALGAALILGGLHLGGIAAPAPSPTLH